MFLLTMFANPLVRKIAIIFACVLSFLLVARWYGNREYYKGVDEGVKTGAERLLKAKEAEWNAKEASISSKAQKVATESMDLENRRGELAHLREDLNATLAKIQITGQVSNANSGATVAAIPGDQLDDAIRRQSAKLGPPQTIK
jgi:hypothetical protein